MLSLFPFPFLAILEGSPLTEHNNEKESHHRDAKRKKFSSAGKDMM